jgi:hypothetical protein
MTIFSKWQNVKCLANPYPHIKSTHFQFSMHMTVTCQYIGRYEQISESLERFKNVETERRHIAPGGIFTQDEKQEHKF